MFALLKEKLDLVEVAEELLQTPFKQIGDSTYAPEDEVCPHCGHKDCYRIKKDGPDSFFKCFSCDKHGDVVTMVSDLKGISIGEAVKLLADHYKIEYPRDYSPVQIVLNLAAQYYHNCFFEASSCAELSGLTPQEYQKSKRGHDTESFDRFMIGWSDGKLVEYLLAVGTDETIIRESGLMNKSGKDFFPAKTFIYPHKVKGRISHFTFKDPLKQKAWQLPSKNKLNDHSFYNSDSASKNGPVLIVEGENDVISIVEAGWESGVLCCNGSISVSQLDWMVLHLKDREVITLFDIDAAGDKYRDKVGRLSKYFKKLTQVKLPGPEKDIDEFLKNGKELSAALISPSGKQLAPSVDSAEGEAELEVEPNETTSSIIEKKGAYYKIRYKDGNEQLIRLTNFTIKMVNVFIRGTSREREIVIKREDGVESAPTMIASEAKVSLKLFRTLVANAVDASFYGKEEDLTAIWEYVYKNSDEAVVYLPECIGRVSKFSGWLFGDCFITETGATYTPDESGVIWLTSEKCGLRPISMETGGAASSEESIPKLLTGFDEKEREELLGGYITNLAKNLGNTGMAIDLTAWAWATVHSDEIFKEYRFFPSTYSWGTHGMGKTTINKWTLALFDLEGPGWNSGPQLNSGVSFSRKLSYYSSLPMCIDELKQDEQTIGRYGVFRSWYDRGGRTVSSNDIFGIRTQPVRSTIFYGGEDVFMNEANRDRCIHFRIPKDGREDKISFDWIDSHRADLPAIGYHWIVNRSKLPEDKLVVELREMDKYLRNSGVSSRTARNVACIAIFGKRLAEKYFPEFDYLKYATTTSERETTNISSNNPMINFWQLLEGLQAEDRSRITPNHLRREGNELYVWWNDIFRIVSIEDKRSGKNEFSASATKALLEEEKYFLGWKLKRLGMGENQRNAAIIDISKAPQSLQHIAAFLE